MDKGFEYVSSKRGYDIYRKIVDGRGKWKAVKDGKEMDITYDQALGYEPLDNAEALGIKIGKILLPQ